MSETAAAPAAQPVVPQSNEAAARTATGEIKDQQATQPAGTVNTEPTKPAVETKPLIEAKPGEAKTEPAKGPPEKYDFKAPDGYEIDTKFIEEVSPVLKELGLDNAQAQKLLDVQIKREQALADGPYQQYEETRKGWRDEIIKDTAIGDGKDGLKPEAKAFIDKAIQSIGDAKAIAAFKEAMDLTGAGDNPAFVRAMVAFGRLASEGTSVRGAGPATTGQTAPGATARPSPAQALYPNNPTSARA